MHTTPQPSLPATPPPAYLAPPTTATATPVDARTRNLAIALWGTALLVLIGACTKSWFTPDAGDGGVGLTGIEVCFRGHCQTAGWDELKHAPKDLGVFAMLGFLGSLASIAFTATVGGLLIAGKAQKVPIKIFNGVLGLTAFATTMFGMRVLTEMSRGISIGWSGLLTIGGLLAISLIVQYGVAPLTRK